MRPTKLPSEEDSEVVTEADSEAAISIAMVSSREMYHNPETKGFNKILTMTNQIINHS